MKIGRRGRSSGVKPRRTSLDSGDQHSKRDSTGSCSTHHTTSFKSDRVELSRAFFAHRGEDQRSFRKIVIGNETRSKPKSEGTGPAAVRVYIGAGVHYCSPPLLFQAVKPRCDWPFGRRISSATAGLVEQSRSACCKVPRTSCPAIDGPISG